MNQQQQQQQQQEEDHSIARSRGRRRRNKRPHQRCHGNRKLRRLKMKYRRRGMTEQEIQQLIQNLSNQQQQTDLQLNEENRRELHPLMRRRNKQKSKYIQLNHRLPNYLTKGSNLLIQSLTLQLQQDKINKKQQRFLLKRLQLLDQHYCIEQQQQLWQSYLNHGNSSNIWPVSYLI
jgi:hypothetical protein